MRRKTSQGGYEKGELGGTTRPSHFLSEAESTREMKEEAGKEVHGFKVESAGVRESPIRKLVEG